MTRQVSQILKQNSENTVPSAPFISCYIRDLKFDQARMQDPTFVSTVNIRERAIDPITNQYLNTQGSNYTVQRLMPTPYLGTFVADIWTSNTDQKLQIWEQISVLFNPSLELQTTDNYIDWTSISVLTLKDTRWSSRQIPQGIEQDIDILTMDFETQIWITPPAKVMQLGVITKIIASVFTDPVETIEQEFGHGSVIISDLGKLAGTEVTTFGNYNLLVLDNQAQLVYNQTESEDGVNVPIAANRNSWYSVLDLYPGNFRPGLSQLRLTKPNGNEIIAYISLNPSDESKMQLNIDADTVPSNTIIASLSGLSNRGTIDAIVNPETFVPKHTVAGIRYLILENININSQYETPSYDGPRAWKNADGSDRQLYANDIIEWSGTAWTTVFSSSATTEITYITNTYTGVQYKWDPAVRQWSKSFEGIYDRLKWRLVL
jgi:hypothetical protein